MNIKELTGDASMRYEVFPFDKYKADSTTLRLSLHVRQLQDARIFQIYIAVQINALKSDQINQNDKYFWNFLYTFSSTVIEVSTGSDLQYKCSDFQRKSQSRDK